MTPTKLAFIAGLIVAVFMGSTLLPPYSPVPTPDPVRSARQRSATAVTESLRLLAKMPEGSRRVQVVYPDINGLIHLPLGGPTYVAVGPEKDEIIVDMNGRTQIEDTNGDGTYDSCFDCPVGQEPEDIQETFDSGITSALEKLGVTE